MHIMHFKYINIFKFIEGKGVWPDLSKRRRGATQIWSNTGEIEVPISSQGAQLSRDSRLLEWIFTLRSQY